MGYFRNEGLNFAWDLGVIFLGVPNWEIGGFSKKKIEKKENVWVVSLYTYLKGFIFL